MATNQPSKNSRTKVRNLVVYITRVGLHSIRRGASATNKIVQLFEPWGIFLAVVGLSITVMGFTIELEDRQSERIFRAWGVVIEFQSDESGLATVEPEIRRSGVREALQFLNREFGGRGCAKWVTYLSVYFTGNNLRECIISRKQRESLRDLSMPRANFFRIELPGAELAGSNFGNADLAFANLLEADLSGASLQGARLLCANLYKADLSSRYHGPAFPTSLVGADLRQADLQETDLRGANFSDADLSDADLREADLGRYLSGPLADLQGTRLGGADLRRTIGIECPQLMQAIDWQQAYRDVQLACGEPIPDFSSASSCENTLSISMF